MIPATPFWKHHTTYYAMIWNHAHPKMKDSPWNEGLTIKWRIHHKMKDWPWNEGLTHGSWLWCHATVSYDALYPWFLVHRKAKALLFPPEDRKSSRLCILHPLLSFFLHCALCFATLKFKKSLHCQGCSPHHRMKTISRTIACTTLWRKAYES